MPDHVRTKFFLCALFIAGFWISGCGDTPPSPPHGMSKSAAILSGNTTPVYSYRIINTFPHDKSAFTQGLCFYRGILYEGTGLQRLSSLRIVNLETGSVMRKLDLPQKYFGEGITVYDNKIVQLTYQNRIGFVYNKNTFEKIKEFTYRTEGWGITYNGQYLIMSDGSPTLHFLDPASFEEMKQVKVYDESGPVYHLNELEYIHGEIYANVWMTDSIVRINPHSGRVTGRIDLTGLLSPQDMLVSTDVLNGIAYDEQNDRLFVTGKFWPKLFEIKLITAVSFVFPQPGYYMISLPVVPDNNSAASLFPVMRSNSALEWNAATARYQNVQHLETGTGYWIYIDTPGTVTVSGSSIEKYDTHLLPGWNLIAAPFQSTRSLSTEPAGAVQSVLFGYETSNKTFFKANMLEPMRGYFVHAQRQCRLTVQSTSTSASASKAALIEPDAVAPVLEPPAPPLPPRALQ